MRIALIGAGYMGAQHAAAFRALPDVDVVSVTGSAAGLGVLEEADVDAVCVTTPTATHEAICIAALDAGKHVFCETPLAGNAEAAVRMRDAARKAERHLQVALLMRFARPATELVEALRRERLGRPLGVRLGRYAPGTGGAHHGDALEELMLFDLDIALRALGTPERVSCVATPGETGRLDHGFASLDYGDLLATCEASYRLPPGSSFHTVADAEGADGFFEGRFEHPRDGPPSVRIRRTLRDGGTEEDTALGENPIHLECRHFADVVHGKADCTLLAASEALAGLRILDALRRALASDAWETFA